MFACMGCREDDAFLTCFGGEPLAEEESEPEPEKAPRRKLKRREIVAKHKAEIDSVYI